MDERVGFFFDDYIDRRQEIIVHMLLTEVHPAHGIEAVERGWGGGDGDEVHRILLNGIYLIQVGGGRGGKYADSVYTGPTNVTGRRHRVFSKKITSPASPAGPRVRTPSYSQAGTAPYAVPSFLPDRTGGQHILNSH